MRLSLVFIISIIYSSAPAAIKTLELKDALKKGMDYSVEIKKAFSQVSEAEDNVSKAKGSIFPTVNAIASAVTKQNSSTLTSSSTTITSAGDTYAVGLTLSQPLYVGGAITSGLGYYKSQEEIARQSYFSVKQDTTLSVLTSFYNLAMAQQLSEAAVQNRDLLKAYVDITNHYEKIGRSRKIDKLKAQVNYTLSLADLEQIQNMLKINQTSLKKLIGEESGDITLKANHDVVIAKVENISPEQAFISARKNNPIIRINQLKVESVDYSKDLDLATDFPSLYLNGATGYQSPDRGSLFNDTSKTYSIGLNLTVPLFSGLTSISKRSAYNEKTYQAKRDLQIAENDLRAKIENNIQAIKTYRTQLDLAQNSVRESKVALDMANKGYQQGIASSTDVADLQKTRYEAEKLFINSQFNHLISVLNLRNLMGIDLEKAYAK